jgi:hypothetical protein
MAKALLFDQFSPPFEAAAFPLRTILPEELCSESTQHNLN